MARGGYPSVTRTSGTRAKTSTDGVPRAVIYVEGPLRPKELDVGRQRKLEACRAYCFSRCTMS